MRRGFFSNFGISEVDSFWFRKLRRERISENYQKKSGTRNWSIKR